MFHNSAIKVHSPTMEDKHVTASEDNAGSRYDHQSNSNKVVSLPPHLEGANSTAALFPEDIRPALCPQLFGSVVAALTHVGVGATVGFSGVTLPQLIDTTSDDIILTQHQASFFSSSVHVGATLGALLGVLPLARFGQRITLLCLLPLSLVAWLMLAFTTNYPLMIVSRILMGTSMGVTGVAANYYVVEITHSEYRGQISGLVDVARQSGFMLVYVLGGSGLSWRVVAMVCGTLTTLLPFIGFLPLPNSPRWLASKGKEEKARSALNFYRGRKYDITDEFTAIMQHVNSSEGGGPSLLSQLRSLCTSSLLSRLLLMTFLLASSQLSGNSALVTFTVPIFMAATDTVDAYTSAMIIGGVRVMATILYLGIVDRMERKTLIIITSLVCGLSISSVGAYFYLKNSGTDVFQLSWLPLTSLVLFTTAHCCMHPVLGLLQGELLPTNVRAAGNSISYSMFFFVGFITSQTFTPMVDSIGEEGVFWFYGSWCILLMVVVATSLPETKGKTLEQIQDIFEEKKEKNATTP